MKAAIFIFIFITLCLISGQVCFSVFGCAGGSLMFKCMYTKEMKTDEQHKGKYFCRDRSCKMSISADVQSRWVYNGRFALYDDENSRSFTVFIRNISREDEWEYRCGNSQTWSRDVKLVVNRSDSSCGKKSIRDGYLGQKKITFHCKYDEKFKTHTKVFYRLNQDPVHVLTSSGSSGSSQSSGSSGSSGSSQSSGSSGSSQSSEEKFILSDSHKDHFNVTIRDISAADGGVYLCGVERNGSDHQSSEISITYITFIKEIELNVSGKITSVQVQAYSSTSVFFMCKFPQEFKGNKKFLQKGSSQKISVDEQNQWVHHGNVHTYDDPSEGRLKVFISDLTTADEATYRCGVNITDVDLFTVIKLTVNKVDHFPALREASAIIGESVKLTCNFPEKHNEIFKHICKENEQKICESIRSSETRVEFSASTAGAFTVSISNVSVRDAGVYWCGAETRHTHLTSVSLTNQHQLTVTRPLVIGREGGSSEIKCPYDEKHSTEIKYLCKGKCFTNDAQNIIRSDEAHVNKPNVSVKDETELHLFTVTLSELRAEDAGIYWCAVKEAFNLPIELMIVLKDALVTEASVGGSVSIRCKSVRNQTLFCRGDQPNICVRDGVRVSSNTRTNGRFSLTDETSAGVFTVNISNLTEEDSGKYWCAEETSGSLVFTEVHLNVTEETTASQDEGKSGSSVIVVVSVGLILLAVCLVLMLLKRKYSCKHGIISSSDRRETRDHEMVQGSDPTSTPLYSTVQSPTIPSDSQNPLYSTVQLLTIPSDSQNPLYSTLQSPTIPSDRVLYASVSFQKHDESLSDADVTFCKNEILSDYASVKHSNTPNYYHQ